VGVCAQQLGQNFVPHVPGALQALAAVIQAAGAREEDNINATENAISSLGKMCEFQRQAMPSPEAVVPQWLAQLPIYEAGPGSCCTL